MKERKHMANITVQREKGSEGAASSPSEWQSPFRLWRDVLRRDPFARMLPGGWEEERALFAPDARCHDE
jgi:hypothetical protein